MPAQIAIIHGWSDTSKSFRDLRDFLVSRGYEVAQIWLGDYVSMDDDVRIEDVGKRMQSVLSAAIAAGDLTEPFDLIVHSTGGLVAREWVSRFYPDGRNCPARRIVMLAPANFGSRLASMGKSMIGRVAKGWNNWFQTGQQMLSGLELASPYQWNLARRDLLDADGNSQGPYGEGRIWPFVITGSRPYSDGLRQIVNENGSDGTVRVAAANLNVSGLTIDFSEDAKTPGMRPWHWRAENASIPFAVLPDRDHGSIIRPHASTGPRGDGADALGRLILEALACRDDADYARIHRDWHALSEATAALGSDPAQLANAFEKDPPTVEQLHQYMQIVTFIRDDHGVPLDDYFLEFFAPGERGDRDAVFFHTEVLEHVHVNGDAPSRRCLFVDRTDLIERYYPIIASPQNRKVAISISAAAIGPNVRYFDKTKVGAEGSLVVHEANEAQRSGLGGARLNRNSTHLVEIIVPRQPLDKVFKLSR